jgi:hypothetical protein
MEAFFKGNRYKKFEIANYSKDEILSIPSDYLEAFSLIGTLEANDYAKFYLYYSLAVEASSDKESERYRFLVQKKQLAADLIQLKLGHCRFLHSMYEFDLYDYSDMFDHINKQEQE